MSVVCSTFQLKNKCTKTCRFAHFLEESAPFLICPGSIFFAKWAARDKNHSVVLCVSRKEDIVLGAKCVFLSENGNTRAFGDFTDFRLDYSVEPLATKSFLITDVSSKGVPRLECAAHSRLDEVQFAQFHAFWLDQINEHSLYSTMLPRPVEEFQRPGGTSFVCVCV